MQARRLYRSRTNRWIAGIAGGMAEYLGVPVILMRLIWLLLLIPGGLPGFVPYVLLWIVVPEDPDGRYL